MQRHFARLDRIDDIAAAIEYGCEVAKEEGVVRQSYHVTPLFEEPTSPSTIVYSRGFSQEWLDLYQRAEFRRDDPIPRRVLESGTMMTWREAMEAKPNTPANEAYFEAMRDHGLIHGFGVPLFGMHGRDAYAAIDFGRPIEEVSDSQLGLVRAIAQAAHQRVCVLIESAPEKISLSEREREVLEWFTEGKSLSVTADIMGLSPDTVKTYARRIYAKLDASDRVGAVVKALRLGLVHV
ncbi:LuxR family transcriptional regulator [Erythrobacter sp.]|uniref:helix-turn-helix transcriptional regulator n=1 Tax=Erythrobacter sp. TaxID=1042 RepID=UPI001425E8E0|nr:LuxR family transcriptional regulator [Erythrobacter sp.]QIQ86152.1 MAG: LuxR family transcriptional regulator [Erythrobacter sp.]